MPPGDRDTTAHAAGFSASRTHSTRGIETVAALVKRIDRA